jgi:hypothetical protein
MIGENLLNGIFEIKSDGSRMVSTNDSQTAGIMHILFEIRDFSEDFVPKIASSTFAREWYPADQNW